MSDTPAPIPWSNLLNSLITGTTAVPKSVAKLIDTVGEQIGLFLEPAHTRRKGQAKADVAVREAEAKAEVAFVRFESKLAIRDLEDRVEERVRRRETKRQENLESIIGHAVRELPESVADQPVDEDWVAEFFNRCEDVSNEQMQMLWARLLAGEVAKPGSFSLRTVALIRTMSKKYANLFTRFCSLFWRVGDDLMPIVLNLHKIGGLSESKLAISDFLRLAAIQLITFEPVRGFRVNLKVPEPLPDPSFSMDYQGRRYVVTRKNPDPTHLYSSIEVGNVLLTDIGEELAPIAGYAPNEEYRKHTIDEFNIRGWELTEL